MVCFKAKRTTQFRKLMKAYCERQGANVEGSLHRRGQPCARVLGAAFSCNVSGRALCTLRTGLTLEQVSFLFEGNRVRCALLPR